MKDIASYFDVKNTLVFKKKKKITSFTYGDIEFLQSPPSTDKSTIM